MSQAGICAPGSASLLVCCLQGAHALDQAPLCLTGVLSEPLLYLCNEARRVHLPGPRELQGEGAVDQKRSPCPPARNPKDPGRRRARAQTSTCLCPGITPLWWGRGRGRLYLPPRPAASRISTCSPSCRKPPGPRSSLLPHVALLDPLPRTPAQESVGGPPVPLTCRPASRPAAVGMTVQGACAPLHPMWVLGMAWWWGRGQ